MEKRRRCGWLTEALATPPRVVWARKGAATEICPKSYISAGSETLVEKFFALRRLGWEQTGELDAREAEAFLILTGLLEEEMRHERI
jgi:hypothetical protein